MNVFKHPLLTRMRQVRRIRGSDAPAFATLPPRLHLIWSQRKDLQDAFSLELERDRIKAFWWFYMHAFRELGLPYDARLDGDANHVNAIVPGLKQHGLVPITWLMRQVWRNSSNHPYGNLDDPREQQNFIAEFFAFHLTNYCLDALLTPNQSLILKENSNEDPGVPRILQWIFETDSDLQSRFAAASDPAFVDWCLTEGAGKFPILRHPLIALARQPATRPQRPRGVNVVGYANVRLGIAEDLRMAARSLAADGIPFSICRVPVGASLDEHDDDAEFEFSEDLPFDTNLFCMTGMGTVTARLAQRGRFDQHRNIGLWPWELPEWPDFWQHAYDYVDEVWAASQFSAEAYRKSSHLPVKPVPAAVTVDESDHCSRLDFGLPNDEFLFAFTFDGLSAFARKNPQAVVRSFKLAFADTHKKVGLVIKGLRVERSPEWDEILSLIGNDKRIRILTESMTRGKILDFYRNIDCFISLHRSEGFGRNIIECMALGKPVITTAFSGNMDFTHGSNAALVAYTLRQVAPGEYPFGIGQYWADPDIDDAALQMRRMVDDLEWRTKLAANGCTYVKAHYSPEAVGKAWRAALGSVLNKDWHKE